MRFVSLQIKNILNYAFPLTIAFLFYFQQEPQTTSQRLDPNSSIAIAEPNCWRVMMDALQEPDANAFVIVQQVKEYSGEMWNKCDEFFTLLVSDIFPEKFVYETSLTMFSKELTKWTGMSYNQVRNITIACFLIDVIIMGISSQAPTTVYEP
jgi:hypothetical protein